jgi:hypothetical protein
VRRITVLTHCHQIISENTAGAEDRGKVEKGGESHAGFIRQAVVAFIEGMLLSEGSASWNSTNRVTQKRHF